MHSYSHLWEEFISDQNIRSAIISASAGKRKRPAVAKYYDHIDEHIEEIRYYAEHFYNLPHHEIDINDGFRKKKRHIIIPQFKEQIIHHMLIQTMYPVIRPCMYEHSYAGIPGRGMFKGKKHKNVVGAKNVIEKWIQKDRHNTKYCLKMDIHHFYDSIDISVLKAMLAKRIHDDRFLSVLFTVLDVKTSGLPIGFYTSGWLANWLLNDLDHMIKERLGAVYYVRYADDMVIFGPNKRKLHQMRKVIAEYLRMTLHLEMKRNWQIFRLANIDSEGNDIYRALDFLGFRFYRSRTVLRKSLLHEIRHKAEDIHDNGISYENAKSFSSYRGWINASDTNEYYQQRIAPLSSFDEAEWYISEIAKRRYENDLRNSYGITG